MKINSFVSVNQIALTEQEIDAFESVIKPMVERLGFRLLYVKNQCVPYEDTKGNYRYLDIKATFNVQFDAPLVGRNVEDARIYATGFRIEIANDVDAECTQQYEMWIRIDGYEIESGSSYITPAEIRHHFGWGTEIADLDLATAEEQLRKKFTLVHLSPKKLQAVKDTFAKYLAEKDNIYIS